MCGYMGFICVSTMSVHMCESLRSISHVFLNHSPLYVLRQGFFLNDPGAQIHYAGWRVSELQAFSSLCFASAEIIDVCHHTHLFYIGAVVAGDPNTGIHVFMTSISLTKPCS